MGFFQDDICHFSITCTQPVVSISWEINKRVLMCLKCHQSQLHLIQCFTHHSSHFFCSGLQSVSFLRGQCCLCHRGRILQRLHLALQITFLRGFNLFSCTSRLSFPAINTQFKNFSLLLGLQAISKQRCFWKPVYSIHIATT